MNLKKVKTSSTYNGLRNALPPRAHPKWNARMNGQWTRHKKNSEDQRLLAPFWPKVTDLRWADLMEGVTPEACPHSGEQRQWFWLENTKVWLSIPNQSLFNWLNLFSMFCSSGPMGVCHAYDRHFWTSVMTPNGYHWESQNELCLYNNHCAAPLRETRWHSTETLLFYYTWSLHSRVAG